ncbi:MAG TPA: hypothetical protein VE861_04620 [Gemmatimonadaceae bacterium]|nr:hypothetical protein [Gemmatimonadaceae bacterium]
MAALIDVRSGLAAELKRLVRDAQEWPMRDRRRFRNLLLDASTSDAMPMAELLLLAHDDGLLRALPERSAPRATWDAATARLASDLQSRRFVEPGIARFVAEAWGSALGPDVVPSARVALPRPVTAPRQPMRSSAQVAAAASRAAPAPTVSTAASMRAYRRSNMLFIGVALVFGIGTILVFQQTGSAADRKRPVATTMPVPSVPRTAARFDVQPSAAPPARAAVDSVGPSAPVAIDSQPSTPRIDSATVAVEPRASIEVASAPVRTNDDIVLDAGRVFEGRVLSVRQTSVIVKDEETGLDFEIPKADIDRIVTRDGRVMRFGDDNVPLLGDDDDLTPMSHAGRYRVRYAERWGAERASCNAMARRFAPGSELLVQHMRGAPMMKLEFLRGQGFNAAVRSDGVFESGSSQATMRGPDASFVTTRLSGRLSRNGGLSGVARLTAVMPDGAIVCDLALTMQGERQP